MNPNYYNYRIPNNYQMTNMNNNERFGGFVFPFLLGGVTGAAIAPAFWRPRQPYPVMRPYPPMVYQQPIYYSQPYYR